MTVGCRRGAPRLLAVAGSRPGRPAREAGRDAGSGSEGRPFPGPGSLCRGLCCGCSWAGHQGPGHSAPRGAGFLCPLPLPVLGGSQGFCLRAGPAGGSLRGVLGSARGWRRPGALGRGGGRPRHRCHCGGWQCPSCIDPPPPPMNEWAGVKSRRGGGGAEAVKTEHSSREGAAASFLTGSSHFSHRNVTRRRRRRCGGRLWALDPPRLPLRAPDTGVGFAAFPLGLLPQRGSGPQGHGGRRE